MNSIKRMQQLAGINEMQVNPPLYLSPEDEGELRNLLDNGIREKINLENNTFGLYLEDIENYAGRKFEEKYGPGSYSDPDSGGYYERVKEIYDKVRKDLEVVLYKKYKRKIKAITLMDDDFLSWT